MLNVKDDTNARVCYIFYSNDPFGFDEAVFHEKTSKRGAKIKAMLYGDSEIKEMIHLSYTKGNCHSVRGWSVGVVQCVQYFKDFHQQKIQKLEADKEEDKWEPFEEQQFEEENKIDEDHKKINKRMTSVSKVEQIWQ